MRDFAGSHTHNFHIWEKVTNATVGQRLRIRVASALEGSWTGESFCHITYISVILLNKWNWKCVNAAQIMAGDFISSILSYFKES